MNGSGNFPNFSYRMPQQGGETQNSQMMMQQPEPMGVGWAEEIRQRYNFEKAVSNLLRQMRDLV